MTMAEVKERHLRAARLARQSVKEVAQAIADAEERERVRIANRLKSDHPGHDECDHGHCEGCYLEGVILTFLEGNDHG